MLASITRLISRAEIRRRLKRQVPLPAGLIVGALSAAQLRGGCVAARRGRGGKRVSALFEHAERHRSARVAPGLSVLGVGYHAVLEVERPRHAGVLARGASVEPAGGELSCDEFPRVRLSRSYP